MYIEGQNKDLNCSCCVSNFNMDPPSRAGVLKGWPSLSQKMYKSGQTPFEVLHVYGLQFCFSNATFATPLARGGLCAALRVSP